MFCSGEHRVQLVRVTVSVGCAAMKGPWFQLRWCGVTVIARVGPGLLKTEVSLILMIPGVCGVGEWELQSIWLPQLSQRRLVTQSSAMLFQL